jgi:hypothetical protein
MKECIVRLLIKLGILNLNDLNMRTRKRIFGSITKRKEIKPRAKRHRGVWVKMANIDGEWSYHVTQDAAATFIRTKSIYAVTRSDVYYALRHNRNTVKLDGTLVAYVQYDKPENA